MSSLIWSAAALALVALLMGTTFGHVLEMPAKMKADSRNWVYYQQTFYPHCASVGAVLEVAIAGSALVAWWLRDQMPRFYFAFAAAISLALAFFVVWIFVTHPTNHRTAAWSASAAPHDWQSWRTQWEYSHAGRFVLHLLAFLALAYALLSHAGV